MCLINFYRKKRRCDTFAQRYFKNGRGGNRLGFKFLLFLINKTETNVLRLKFYEINSIEGNDVDLVEILLSFFISENAKNRALVQNCFRQVASQCSQEALEAIAEALDPDSKDGPLDIEDEDDLIEENGTESDSEDENSESDQDDSPEDDREAEKSDEADSENEVESDQEDDEVEGEEIELLKSRLKQAMGDAAIDSDDSVNGSDSEPEDMTDEQMMSLDEVIGNAFKSMKVSKKKEQQQLQLQKENFRFMLKI